MKQQSASTVNSELLDALNRLEQQHAQIAGELAGLRKQFGEGGVEWLPLKRAAGNVGFSSEAIRLWAARGLIAARRIGGRWFIDRHSLQEHVHQRHAR